MNSRDTLLLVDDVAINRAILRGVFEQEYNILEAENGEQALRMLEQYHSIIAAMLLDIVMPVMDGYEVLAESRRRGRLSEVPVIIITANDSTESEVKALDLGASDIIMKPFEPHVVKRRVHNVIELNRHKLHLEELVDEQAKSLRESNEIMMDALSSVIEYRDAESGQHILRIRMFTKILLEEVQRIYPEYDLTDRSISVIASASAMHDIGKIAVPDAILNKPGKLTAEEWEIMKSHSAKGAEILSGLDRMSDKVYLKYAYNICRYHHERWDGGGYPEGLRGENIPICAQVVGIADAFDALTSDRVYKKALPVEIACNMILNGECGSFSPKLLECFKAVYPQFAELSHQYSDGRSPKNDSSQLKEIRQLRPADFQPQQHQLSQMKYMALLRYAKDTVMEVDFDTGLYHMVYMINSDFELLRTGNLFSETIRNFIDKMVYPEDRSIARHFLEEELSIFLVEGYMEYTQRYRILHKATKTYRWYQTTMLRVDLEDPKQHKCLLVWSELQHDEQLEMSCEIAEGEELHIIRSLSIGFNKCRNDRWLTWISGNERLADMLGYTREEMEMQFQHHYLELVYPDDRMKLINQLNSQLRSGVEVELEYRVQSKNGRIFWVLHKAQRTVEGDGSEYLYGMLIDITRSKQAEEEARAATERYNLILEQTNDIIFEWDPHTDRLIVSDNWQENFGYSPMQERVSERLRTESHFHPGDMDVVEQAKEKAISGLTYQELEIRIARADEQYIWCLAKVTAQFDSRKRLTKIIGVVSDIDDEKKATQTLRNRADRDSLTKLYNKNAAKRLIEHSLLQRQPEEEAVMYIIDVDNFKLINDQFGHMFGDAVLVKIAECFQDLFRSGDILARIGGDEFMIFMHCIADEEIIKSKANQIIHALQGLFQEYFEDGKLSCSVGAVSVPYDGEQFQELFQRCDQALYQAKSQGKNQLVIYDRDQIFSSFGRNLGTVMSANTRIESNDLSIDQPDVLIQQAFRQLYEASDTEQAINHILALVGRQFGVSRVYIIENSPDGKYCTNTFEWCNDGIEPEMDFLSHITYESLGSDYISNFNENDIFYCTDIHDLPTEQFELLNVQGIKSMLQCAIRDNGQFVGYVGFDDCTMRRLWTQEQIDAVTFISELVTIFLLKMRAQEKSIQTVDNLRALLDRQGAWIYVIDPDTYQLRYINAKTYQIAPDAQVGMTCYKAFFDIEQPCEHCPAQGIRQKKDQMMEIYNPVLRVWSMANAALAQWDDQEACVLTCSDITTYKEQIKRYET